MIAVLYRWRLHPGSEADFRDAWTEMTEALGPFGSLGSALFDAGDGTMVAIARWPDDATRQAAFATDPLPEAQERMRAATAESFPIQILNETANLWKFAP